MDSNTTGIDIQPGAGSGSAARPTHGGYSERLSAVIEIASTINSQLELDQLLSAIANEMSKIFDFDLGCVAIYNKSENCLYIRDVYRKDGDSTGEGRFVPLDESNLVGWVAINKTPVLRSRISEDRRFDEIMIEDALESDMVVPLLAKGALVGTVNFGSLTPGKYTEQDLQLVKDLSHLISIAIEKTQLMEELRELGDKFRNLMRSTNDIIMMLDTTGDIVECNDAVLRIFGYSREEIIGRPPSEFAPPERRETVRMNFGRVLRGEMSRVIEVPYLKKNGDVVYLDISVNVIRIKDHPYVIVVGHDVSNRKSLEEKITSQNRELKDINRKLTDVDRLKSEFLGRISHELRTPLSVIMAYTGTLQEENGQEIDEATRGEFLQVISDQSNKLLMLINDLLDLSKLEVSETMLDVTESSLNEMIKASLAVIRPLAVQAGISIQVDLDDSIPVIRFDPLRIRQICVNLLSNAIKYTSSGESIRISTRMSRGEAIVSVHDRGPGIDKAHLAGIFENFTQVDGGSARKKNGLGIGLRLVHHFVELHKGRVWVDRDPVRGSIFHFSLPVTGNWG